MDEKEGEAEIDQLEKGLLQDGDSTGDSAPADEADSFNEEEEPILFAASFEEAEKNFMNYQTAQWVLYSLLLILAWGVGLFMLIYLPIRRHILRQDFRSRKLFVTRDAIVYKVTKPVAVPCFGVLRKEKHILLPSVADVVIEQGYLQSHFGIYSIRIEHAGVRRSPSDDVRIIGIANPRTFRKAVLTRLSNMRNEAFSRQASNLEDIHILRRGHSSAGLMSPSKSIRHEAVPHEEALILQKLDEVGSRMKRVQSLIEEKKI